MTGWVRAAFLVFVLATALPAKAAEGLVLTEALFICVANQADPGRVLSTADIRDWKGIPNQPGGVLDLFDMVPAPDTRLKDFDGRLLTLKVKEDVLLMPDWSVRRRICSVFEDAPATASDTVEVVRALGVPPTAANELVSSWAWVDTVEGKRFLPSQADEDMLRALADHTVYVFAVAKEGQRSLVIFYEMSRTDLQR